MFTYEPDMRFTILLKLFTLRRSDVNGNIIYQSSKGCLPSPFLPQTSPANIEDMNTIKALLSREGRANKLHCRPSVQTPSPVRDQPKGKIVGSDQHHPGSSGEMIKMMWILNPGKRGRGMGEEADKHVGPGRNADS